MFHLHKGQGMVKPARVTRCALGCWRQGGYLRFCTLGLRNACLFGSSLLSFPPHPRLLSHPRRTSLSPLIAFWNTSRSRSFSNIRSFPHKIPATLSPTLY